MLHYLILISLCKLSRNFFFESLLMEYFFSLCSGPSSDCPKVLYAASDLSITVRVIQSDTQRSLMTARVPGSDWVSTGAHQLSNRSQTRLAAGSTPLWWMNVCGQVWLWYLYGCAPLGIAGVFSVGQVDGFIIRQAEEAAARCVPHSPCPAVTHYDVRARK